MDARLAAGEALLALSALGLPLVLAAGCFGRSPVPPAPPLVAVASPVRSGPASTGSAVPRVPDTPRRNPDVGPFCSFRCDSPERREQLREALRRGGVPKRRLTPERMLDLATVPTDPSDEDQFHRRVVELEDWIDQIGETDPERGQALRPQIHRVTMMFYTNRRRALRVLDRTFRTLYEH